MASSVNVEEADQLAKEVMAYVGAEKPGDVTCPREQSSMTPCIARDGGSALADDGACVACSERPGHLLEDVRARVALRKQKGS